MSIFYSPSKEGFYDTAIINYPSLPDDCIEITEEQKKTFLNEMSMHGKHLVLVNNKLVLESRPVVITWQSVRDSRNILLNESDYTQVPDFPGNKEAWTKYRQLLRDIPQTYNNPEDVVWPEKPKN